MSGGIIASLSLAACVPAYIVGTIGKETLKIVANSSVSAYDQFHIAAECRDEISALVREYQSRCIEHENECNLIRSQIRNSTENEINRLISKLRSEGCPAFELVIDGSSEEKLIRLIALELEYSGRKLDEIRSPEELYNAVCEITNRWLAIIPEGFAEHAEIIQFQKQAQIIATDESLLASDKSIKLKKLETKLINSKFNYDKLANRCRSQLADFMGLKVAAEKIACALGETFTATEYSPVNAENQIEELSNKVDEFRDKLRKNLTDKEFLASNKILAEAVINSVEEAGYTRVERASEEYGESAVYEYGNSLLKVIVSKEGRLSMNIVGKQGESKELIYSDEESFCNSGIERINSRLEANGIRMNINLEIKLSDDSIIYTVVDRDEDSGGYKGASQPTRRTMYINRDGRTVIQ